MAPPRPLTGGVYVPTVAFFDANEDIDIATTEKHAIFLAKSGVAGIVVQGSNGEAVHLDRAERKLIASTTRKALDSAGYQIPVIVGVGAQSTRETITFAKDAAEAGCDYVIALPPSYYKSLDTSTSRIQYFRDVADASPIPVLIYNYPGATSGVDLDSDEILALSQHPNIAGTKLTCGNTGKLARIASSVKRSDFSTFGGSCDFTLQTLIAGGQGVIAGTANVIPRASIEVYKLYTQGKIAEAQKLQSIVARADWVAIKGGYPAVKAALQAFYGYGGVPRRPTPAADVAATKAAFEEAWAVETTLA